jgi:hypothetical protein
LIKKAMILAGCSLLLFSVFAQQLGIDNDQGWGTGRIAILVVGFALMAGGFTAYRYPEKYSNVVDTLWKRWYLIVSVAFVALIYLWVSQINIEHTREHYPYYAELARSFKDGRLHLSQKPSETLLALENPYDYDLRVQANVEDFPWDVSLYKEKFYLYYGPVPAVLLTVFSEGFLSQIGDRHLVIAFAFGLFMYEILIMLKFLARSTPQAPAWLVGIAILTLGLTAPTAIMLQESRLYQAAVFGCQFFLIGGCYWIYSTITDDRPTLWKLTLAGVHWGLALGTRSAILPVILYAAVIAMIGIFFVFRLTLSEMRLPFFATAFPLLFAAASLAWYNQVRFDSIFEFGLKYTLTNMNYLTGNGIFSAGHLRVNFYNYFLHPFRLSSQFPYLFRIEYIFSSERLAGLFFIAPYIFFALKPFSLRGHITVADRMFHYPSMARSSPEFWLLVICAGSAVIGAITVHLFWTTEMRYIEDFMPSLLLFTNANVALGYNALANHVRGRKVFILVAVLLAGITVVASTLVALKSDSLLIWTNWGDTVLRILNLK